VTVKARCCLSYYHLRRTAQQQDQTQLIVIQTATSDSPNKARRCLCNHHLRRTDKPHTQDRAVSVQSPLQGTFPFIIPAGYLLYEHYSVSVHEVLRSAAAPHFSIAACCCGLLLLLL
jgi:hypothetical protein